MSGALAELLVDAPHGRNARVAGPEGESWDRAALLALARRTAAALAAGGVQPAEPVHLTVANRPADLGALLGVWLAGAVAVPVHRAAPASASERLRRATGARFAVDAGALAVIGGAPPRARDLLADAALVLFTSGSTGQPKGVVLGHARFAGKLAAAGRRHDRRPDRAGRFPPGGGGRRGRARGRDRRAAARDPFGMAGYLDDPALTAAAFSAGFLKTGDLARLRPDGRVALVGRIAEIVSRGGNKIAPAEIEDLFAGHPDVQGALSTGVPDERLGQRLHVLLVARPGSTCPRTRCGAGRRRGSSPGSSRTASISRTPCRSARPARPIARRWRAGP